VELGHTFKLGSKYTDAKAMDVTYLDARGEQRRVIMGCYGIGVERLAASVVERWNDDGGILWPITVAPFEVLLVAIGQKPEVAERAEAIYNRLAGRFELIYDDRNESPGVKLKDADLLGIPIRVVVSQRLMKTNEVEVKVRKTGEVIICSQDEVEAVLEKLRTDLQPSLEGLPYMPEA
jgi:prolyl-tRNA synthetase